MTLAEGAVALGVSRETMYNYKRDQRLARGFFQMRKNAPIWVNPERIINDREKCMTARARGTRRHSEKEEYMRREAHRRKRENK